jgi:hypothetical protein
MNQQLKKNGTIVILPYILVCLLFLKPKTATKLLKFIKTK